MDLSELEIKVYNASVLFVKRLCDDQDSIYEASMNYNISISAIPQQGFPKIIEIHNFLKSDKGSSKELAYKVFVKGKKLTFPTKENTDTKYEKFLKTSLHIE